jgi:DNA-binding transcriptional regulator YdaS (Cro superfamily)
MKILFNQLTNGRRQAAAGRPLGVRTTTVGNRICDRQPPQIAPKRFSALYEHPDIESYTKTL